MLSDKVQIVLELVKSLNQGNTGYSNDRVDMAIKQYNQLVDAGLIQGGKIK